MNFTREKIRVRTKSKTLETGAKQRKDGYPNHHTLFLKYLGNRENFCWKLGLVYIDVNKNTGKQETARHENYVCRIFAEFQKEY
jgi:hypothetical protein